MKNVRVVSHKQKLDSVFDKVNDLKNDPELTAHLSRYLCVLVSGFVEASVRTLIADYATKRSAPEVAHYVGQRLKSFRNAKMNNIIDLVSDFGDDFRIEFKKSINDELKDAVDSVVDNRHQISHGVDVGIGLPAIRKYYESVVSVVEELEKRFGA